MNLRELANGMPCMIRLPGICNFKSDTTVLCHFRLMNYSGVGLKPPDWMGAWGCSDCHRYVDTHHDAETQLAFAHGVFRTQAILFARGDLTVF